MDVQIVSIQSSDGKRKEFKVTKRYIKSCFNGILWQTDDNDFWYADNPQSWEVCKEVNCSDVY